jgi:thiol-disulfide isomerase/thioredoxin
MKRRSLLAGVVGGGAAAVGVLAALLHDGDGDGGAATDAALWRWRPARIGGGDLAFADMRGRPLLLNFWATWCAPCVTEMPMLSRFAAEHPDWHVVGVAVDQEAAVRRFVSERGIAYPIALADTGGLDLARSLGNAAGGLPFTVAFDANGRSRERHLGALEPATLASWSERFSAARR